MNGSTVLPKRSFFLLLLCLVLIFLATIPLYAPAYFVIVLISVFMYVILAVSWTTFCGATNYISLATAAFFGVGIYVSAILKALPLPVLIIIGGSLSFGLGLLVGLTTLRLRGMYFCIFTFGLSELFRHTMMWYEVNITGTVGRWLPLQSNEAVYYYMFVIVLATIGTSYLIHHSKFGLALRSIGQVEEAAAHVGINVNAVKIVIFAITCFFMGAGGVVMSTRWSYIDPDLAFAPFVTFFTIMMILVGGWNSPFWGPILGATTLTLLADTVLAEFPNLTMFLFGAVLVGVITFLPNGLVGLARRIEKSFGSAAIRE
jgi:branched-chain amino acid transport system permease protein